jgi:hypothetical protein
MPPRPHRSVAGMDEDARQLRFLAGQYLRVSDRLAKQLDFERMDPQYKGWQLPKTAAISLDFIRHKSRLLRALHLDDFDLSLLGRKPYSDFEAVVGKALRELKRENLATWQREMIAIHEQARQTWVEEKTFLKLHGRGEPNYQNQIISFNTQIERIDAELRRLRNCTPEAALEEPIEDRNQDREYE